MYESVQRELERWRRTPSPQERADVVIIGYGIAGMTAAREIRRLDPKAQIIIVTMQNYPTIHTPSLKQFLMGKLSREQLIAVPPDMERAPQISLLKSEVSEIVTAEKCILLAGGGAIGYESLLIATGRVAKELDPAIPGYDLDGVVTVHHLPDYFDLRRRLAEVNEIVVIGGGVQGLEMVMSILHHRLPVTWLIRTPTCLPQYLDEAADQLVLEHVRQAGARVITETQVVEILGNVGAVSGVVTSSQQVIPAQLVITSIGTIPQTKLASHCDRPMRYQANKGIIVNDWMQTNVSNILAIGSVAAVKDPKTESVAARMQWAEAEMQGVLAARMLLGRHPGTHSPLGVSWQNISIGKLSILAVGDTLGHTQGSSVWSERRRGTYRSVTIHNDRVVGYLAVGPSIPDPLAIKYVIDEGLSLADISKVLMDGQASSHATTFSQDSKTSHPPTRNYQEGLSSLLHPGSTFTSNEQGAGTFLPRALW
jgi:NAD(P)H-nitrite reductase large subunit